MIMTKAIYNIMLKQAYTFIHTEKNQSSMNQSNSNGLEYKKQFSILVYVILHSCMYLPIVFITCLSQLVIKLRKVLSESILEINLIAYHIAFSFDFHTFDIDKESVPHPQYYCMIYIICPGFSPTYLPRSVLSLCVLILNELSICHEHL